MKKNRKTVDSPDLSDPIGLPALSLIRDEKGSHRSMWEALLQLRVLLPYLSHLAPILERTSRVSPAVNELSRGMQVIQTGSRELETLTRNQTLQLERMEDQVVHLEAAHQLSMEENRSFFVEMRAFRRWMIRITLAIAVIVGATAGMIAYLLLRAEIPN